MESKKIGLFMRIAERIKVGFVTVTSAVDLDKINSYVKTINLNIVGKGVAASKPTTNIIGNTIIEKYGIGDELYFGAMIGHDHASGDLSIRIDFINTGGTVDKEIQWELSYLTHDENETINGTTGTLPTGDIVLSAVQYETQSYIFTIPAAQIKARLHYKIKRIAIVDGTEPSAAPAMMHTHVQYLAKLV